MALFVAVVAFLMGEIARPELVASGQTVRVGRHRRLGKSSATPRDSPTSLRAHIGSSWSGATPAESRPSMIVWTARRNQPFDWHGDIGSTRPGQAFSPLDQYLRRTPIIRRDYPE